MEAMKVFLSNKINLLMIMVCLVFCFQLVSFFSNGNEVEKNNYIKKEITSLKKEIKSIYEAEHALDKKIDIFNQRIENIHEAVIINNTKIDNLKKYEKIQIDKFKSYDARMWEKYFADRYAKKSLPITNTRK
jgi:septal ring factor EnvC (AmiA/AmiB activator)